jgi:hypothetical protein
LLLQVSHPQPSFFPPPPLAAVDEYVCTFDPLVLEEAREGLKSDWAESCAGGRAWPVDVVRCVCQGEGEAEGVLSAAYLMPCASKDIVICGSPNAESLPLHSCRLPAWPLLSPVRLLQRGGGCRWVVQRAVAGGAGAQ